MAAALLSGVIMGAVEGVEGIDNLVVTHAEMRSELDQIVEAQQSTDASIKELRNWNKCDRLERRIERLRDRLFELRAAEAPNPELINGTEREIATAERQFNALECAKALAWQAPTATVKILAKN